PWLLTTAAGGGLEPAPVSRFRGACPHRSSSYTHWTLLGPLRSWRTIVSIPNHLEASCRHALVQRVEIDIGQQRTDDGPLRGSLLGRPSFRCLHHLLGEERFQQFEHS